MRRWCVLVSVMSAVAGIGVSGSTAALADGGRWKVGESGCYWDPNDSGPDQCSPGTGRYKLGAGPVCYWEANDSGPNQCDPGEQAPAETVPEDQPIPYVDDTASIQLTFTGPGTPPGVYCNDYSLEGQPSMIRFSVSMTSDGTLHYSMGMPRIWENYGLWYASTWVDGALRRIHPRSVSPPSGSEPRDIMRPGSVFYIEAVHYFVHFEIYWLPTPDCIFAFCFRPVLVPMPAKTTGSLACHIQ